MQSDPTGAAKAPGPDTPMSEAVKTALELREKLSQLKAHLNELAETHGAPEEERAKTAVEAAPDLPGKIVAHLGTLRGCHGLADDLSDAMDRLKAKVG